MVEYISTKVGAVVKKLVLLKVRVLTPGVADEDEERDRIGVLLRDTETVLEITFFMGEVSWIENTEPSAAGGSTNVMADGEVENTSG